MNSWFDFDNDGKLDPFEEEMERQHILRNLDEMEKSEVTGVDSFFAGLFLVFIIVVLILVIIASI